MLAVSRFSRQITLHKNLWFTERQICQLSKFTRKRGFICQKLTLQGFYSMLNDSNILTFPYCDFSKYACGLADDTPWKYVVLKKLQAHISGDCPISGHCEGVCTPDTMVCALVRASTRDSRRKWHGQKPLIFMRFHEVLLGCQHEIWSKQHNGKVSQHSIRHVLHHCLSW